MDRGRDPDRLIGITPLVDAGDATAFPTFLDFIEGATQLTMTAIVPDATEGVPAPGTLALVGLGLVAASP